MIKNSLVLFYSWSGNTRRAAELIAELAGADLQELRPEVPYPTDYAATVQRVREELQGKVYPPLRPLSADWTQYEAIFLLTLNWCGTMAPPVASFLDQAMPTDKSIIPFCTHGGSGGAKIAADVARYCIGCDLLPLLSLHRGEEAQWELSVAEWLKRVERTIELLRREQQEGGGYPYGT